MSSSKEYLQPRLIKLPSDPGHALSFAYEPGKTSLPLIVFMNGLLQPSTSFKPAIDHFLNLIKTEQGENRLPGILIWDRYGQGLSEKQEKTHDPNEVIETLKELLLQPSILLSDHQKDRSIIFVGNSIGCPLARLYAQKYSKNVFGFLFLDSMIASSDFISIFQEPKDEDERKHLSTKERQGMKIGREKMQMYFHPSLPNAERFDRSQLATYVPFSHQPKLANDPFVTVLGHDHEFFANDTQEKLGIPAFVVDKYMNAEWDKYNQGLVTLTSPDRARGPIRPHNASHFIQISNPRDVAEELYLLYNNVLTMKAS